LLSKQILYSQRWLRKQSLCVNLSLLISRINRRSYVCSSYLCVFVCSSDLLSSDYVEIHYEDGKPILGKV